MINTETTTKSPESNTEIPQDQKPDENSGILFQGFLKIHDPETGEVYKQGRA